jgi:signal transduction histidine kinase
MACRHGLILLSIKDDGSGFDPGGPSARNGLKNLRTRVAKWRGTLQVISEPGKGTEIAVRIPVHL